jgi:hypothetical protein
MPLAEPPIEGLQGMLPIMLIMEGQQKGFSAEIGAGHGRLETGMAASDDDDLVIHG